MKLQPKKEASIAAQEQKRAQIKEGLQLEEIVSSLRKQKSKEEQGLQQFRQGTIQAVQEDIDRLIVLRDELLEELKQKQHEIAVAHLPLEEARRKLIIDEHELEARRSELLSMSIYLDKEESKIEEEKRTVVVAPDPSPDFFTEAYKKFSEADKVLREANEAAAEMRNNAQVILASVEAQAKELELRLKDFEARRATVEMQDAKNKEWDTNLFKRELELKEGWKNLEQTAARIRSGKL